MSEEINVRAYNKAKLDNTVLCRRLKSAYTIGNVKSWKDVTDKFGIDILPLWNILPWNYSNYSSWVFAFEEGFDFRYKAQLDFKPKEIQIISQVIRRESAEVFGVKMGKVTLSPSQYKTTCDIIQSMFIDGKTRAVMNDGKTGDGKTYLCGAILKYVIEKKLVADSLSPCPIIIVVPKQTIVKWERILEEEFEIPLTAVEIVGYGQLASRYGRMFTETRVENRYGFEEEVIYFKKFARPFLIIFDEFHWLKRRGSKRSKFAQALLEFTDVNQIFTSATPFITVQDSMIFALATKAKFMGRSVTLQNWSTFAGSITEKPEKPNAAAAKRLRDYLAPYIFSFAPEKRKHKAINRVRLVTFKTQTAKDYYDESEQRYIEGLKRTGRDVPGDRMLRLVLFNQYRKAAEFCKKDNFIELIFESWSTGKLSPICGVAFQQTLQEITIGLVKLGVPRDQISLIWGGRREISEKDLLSDSQIKDILRKTMAGEDVSSQDTKMLRLTIEYREDRLIRHENEEAQRERMRKFAELKLFKQGVNARQENIDAFQTGESRICIFTAASGGTGLDLDHNHDHSMQRVGYFTLTYWAEEVYQMLGRGTRKFTRSDINQYIIALADTIEAYHTAPKLDKKLQSLQAMLNNRDELVSSLEEQILSQYEELKKQKIILRSEEEIQAADDSMSVEEEEEIDEIDD